MKATALALLAAVSCATPALAQEDLAVDFARLQNRVMTAQSEMMARREQLARLEAKASPPAAIFSDGPDCSEFRAQLRGDAKPSASYMEAERRVDEVIARLVAANHLDIPSLCRVVITPDPAVNGRAPDETAVVEPDEGGLGQLERERQSPKGVFLTAGLLRALNDDDELAAVLGHELSHLALYYTRDIVTDTLAAQRIAGDWKADAYFEPADQTLSNWVHGQQQSAEIDADHLGAILMARAGYDPAGMGRMLAALETFDQPSLDHPAMRVREQVFTAELPRIRGIAPHAGPPRSLDEIRRLIN